MTLDVIGVRLLRYCGRHCDFRLCLLLQQLKGISDQVAFDYMERHGQATWQVIASDLRRTPSCPKLQGYWHFHGCP
jgi:hypothetical protein